MIKAALTAIEYHLPSLILTNDDLAAEFPDWTAQKIAGKTGIAQRHIAAGEELSSDIGIAAAQKLFASGVCQAADIDYILLCTQSPDYFLPTTACVIQDRLGIPTQAGALDFNLGCSGFVYGLGIAKGLIESSLAHNVLLITAETYSKYLGQGDKSTRTIFGDGAAATLVQAVETEDEYLGPFVWGTDGSGAKNLIVEKGGMRYPHSAGSQPQLFMDGAEIFSFTLSSVPAAVNSLLEKSGKSLDDIDLFVFHQANQYMLDHLRTKIGIAPEKFIIDLENYGNTVSSTIPIAMKDAMSKDVLRPGQLVMTVGFGVGYSWAAGLLRVHTVQTR